MCSLRWVFEMYIYLKYVKAKKGTIKLFLHVCVDMYSVIYEIRT
jgi:hypothetical protein